MRHDLTVRYQGQRYEVTVEVSSWGERGHGPTWGCGGQPDTGPEYEVVSCYGEDGEMVSVQPGGPLDWQICERLTEEAW